MGEPYEKRLLREQFLNKIRDGIDPQTAADRLKTPLARIFAWSADDPELKAAIDGNLYVAEKKEERLTRKYQATIHKKSLSVLQVKQEGMTRLLPAVFDAMQARLASVLDSDEALEDPEKRKEFYEIAAFAQRMAPKEIASKTQHVNADPLEEKTDAELILIVEGSASKAQGLIQEREEATAARETAAGYTEAEPVDVEFETEEEEDEGCRNAG